MSLRWRGISALTACILAVPAMADAPAGYWKLPGTETSMQVYGFMSMDVVDDLVQPNGTMVGLGGADATVADNARAKGEIDMTAEASRFGFRTTTPTEYGDANVRFEGDFLGGGSDKYNAGKGNLRIRHFYGEIGNFLAGKTLTNFCDPDGSPNYIDWDGLLADFYGSSRWAQLRYTFNFNKQASLAVALERVTTSLYKFDQTDFTGGQKSSQPADYSMTKSIPALTARFNYADSWGHVSASLGYQRYSTFRNDAAGNNVKDHKDSLSWSASGSMNFGDDSIVAHVGIGDGSYGADLQDWAVYTTSGKLDLIKAKQADFGYEHFWTKKVHSNVFGSWVGYSRNADKGMTLNGFSSYVQLGANTLWDLTKTVHFNVEYIYGWAKTFDANSITQADTTTHSGDRVHENKVHLQFKWNFF